MSVEKKKIRAQLFRIMVIISFVCFLTLFIANKYGYYEFRNHQRTMLTLEQIQQFEQDVKDGKEIDLQDYLTDIRKDYQNNVSRAGLNISNTVSNIVSKGVEGIFDSISRMINENRD